MTQKNDTDHADSEKKPEAKPFESEGGEDESSTEREGDDSHLHDDQKAFSLKE